MKYLITIFLTVAFLFPFTRLQSQQWTVEVTADEFAGDTLFLAYYLGSAQYILDTAVRAHDRFVFADTSTLHPGVYMVVFPPANQFFQILIGEGEHDLVLKVKMDDVQHPYHIRGSKETELFYQYINFLQEKRTLADSLKKLVDSSEVGEVKTRHEAELKSVDTDVKAYQHSLVDKYPRSLTALIINANIETETPEFQGTENERQLQLYHFVKAHFFDNLAMKDSRLVRTPMLHQKLEYYVNKLTPQIPDSINQSIDVILNKFDTSSEGFKIYLVYFLNHYAKSKIVGMDAVYVHLAEKYYAKGYATWTEKEQLDKIIKNAETLKPLLIGKIAPDLLMRTRFDNPINLHSVSSPFTVLFFWDPDCGHCKKSIPGIIEFYKTYKSKGVEIFSVCTRLQDDVPKCWESIEEHHMGEWINVVDPYLRSRFKQIYDIRTTPQIYILDKDKKIVMKKISAEQLPEVMDRLLEEGQNGG